MSEGPQRPESEDETEVRAIEPEGDQVASEQAAAEPAASEPAAPGQTAPERTSPDATVSAAPPPLVVRTSGGRGLAALALIISLLLVIALAVPIWFVYRGEDPLAWVPSPRIDAFESRVAGLETDLGAARRASREALAREAELRNGMDALGRAFTALSAQTAADDPIDDRQWRIAETAYLLRVANLRAGMEDDRQGAEALLRAADELLREIDDFGLVPVREAIAIALADLRSAPAVDRVGLYLELEGLGEQIDQLQSDLPEFAPPSAMTTPITASDDWASALRNRFAGLIDFRAQRPAPVRPLMAPQDMAFMRHNLALKLEQAQLALLQRDAVVWRRSLTEAHAWIQDYFDAATPAARELASALTRLAEARIEVRAPDISAPHSELLRLRGRASFLEPIARPAPTSTGRP